MFFMQINAFIVYYFRMEHQSQRSLAEFFASRNINNTDTNFSCHFVFIKI